MTDTDMNALLAEATQEREEHWQSYDNFYFLQLNLERLTADEQDEIIKTYFIKDDVEGEGGVKMHPKYKHSVLVKEFKDPEE